MAKRSSRAMQALIGNYISLYPDEAANNLETQPLEEIVRLLESHPNIQAVSVVDKLTPDLAARIIELIKEDLAKQVLRDLDPARAVVILSRLDENTRNNMLSLLDEKNVSELRELLSYPADSAGSLMDPKVMAFKPEMKVKDALTRLRKVKQKRIQEVYLVDEAGHLTGSVSLMEIAISPHSSKLEQISRPVTAQVQSVSSREEVVDELTQRRLASLPVVDFDGRLIGVIRYDALVSAVEAETSADIQAMVGASREERALSKVSFAVRKRLPWLEINLGTAFLAAAVVGIFESTIAKYTALAVLLPVVAGQSGNTGSQALAVTMRGLVLREIRISQWLKVSLKEIKVGFLNGLVVAVTTSAAVYMWSRSTGLALVIGISMVASMTIAGLSGAAVPLVLTSLRQDPAQSSSIILTTVTDVMGFLSFLGIATLLAGML